MHTLNFLATLAACITAEAHLHHHLPIAASAPAITQAAVASRVRAAAVVTVTVTSWTTTVVTKTETDTVVETVTKWVPPPTTVRSTTSTTTSSRVSSTARSTTQPPAPEQTQTKYGQCGGSGYTGATKCAAGSSCSAKSFFCTGTQSWAIDCIPSAKIGAKAFIVHDMSRRTA
ncbi:hypothetical protein CkaCkLH20_01961 [Colletotrichum karsti]|uniref:CBM1 domain-containing protein n=1 Tax=Colletotrichum karsti TaxID=1095194 RepID=A0A9P6LLX8_9PEZI|nr:uncharacterized protein CkaCkLH20_01961 [Colletotrichum karsti]KAF9880919.1 hypothetical protein CkaCkLH20_01961 [Colletotrichum karsti]